MLISELDGPDRFPIQSQVACVCDNEKIGIIVTNRGCHTMVIEKSGQPIAGLLNMFNKPRVYFLLFAEGEKFL